MPKGSAERISIAKRKRKEHRNKWIVKRYREGHPATKLAEKYKITPTGAYLVAKNAAINDATINRDRDKALGTKGQKQHLSKKRTNQRIKTPVGKNSELTPKQITAFQKAFEKKFNLGLEIAEKKQKAKDRNLQVLRMAQWGYSIDQIAKSLGVKYGNASLLMHQALKNNPSAKAKREAALKKVENAVGERQISKPRPTTKPKENITKPKENPKLKIKQAKTISDAEEKIRLTQDQLNRTKSRQGIFAKTQARLPKWQPKRRTIKTSFRAEATEFIKNSKIKPNDFNRLVNAFRTYFGEAKKPNPSSVADKLINLKGKEKINLGYTQIFQFASWASYRNYKQLKK